MKDEISFHTQTPHTKIKENVDEKYTSDKKWIYSASKLAMLHEYDSTY